MVLYRVRDRAKFNYLFKRSKIVQQMENKPPLSPFTLETAKTKVQAAEDAWHTRAPKPVALAYTEDSPCRNPA